MADHVTLFVGKNGAGKSTILDALAVSISTFLCGIDGGVSRSIQKEDSRYHFYDLEGVTDAQHQFPVVITGKGVIGKREIQWTRSLNSVGGKTTIKEAHEMISIAERMQKAIMDGDSEVTLPIISYYGTGRLYAQKKEKKDIQKYLEYDW